MRRNPVYLTTFTGRPPDEPSVIGAVLNDLALPTIIRQLPEVTDVWLPPVAWENSHETGTRCAVLNSTAILL